MMMMMMMMIAIEKYPVMFVAVARGFIPMFRLILVFFFSFKVRGHPLF